MFGGDVHKTDAFDEDIFSVPKSVPDKHVPDKQAAEKQPDKSDQSLPTSVVCWNILQTVWVQIMPLKMSGLIWIQTVCHSDGNPEGIFKKK